MTSAAQQGSTTTPGAPSDPDTGLTDPQLENELRSELVAAQRGPHAPSGWAQALGDTRVDLGGGAGGGGYSFSAGELNDVLQQWQRLHERAQAYDQEIHTITSVTTAAEDEASGGFTDQARTLGTTVQSRHAALKAYVANYIEKLRAAQQRYDDTEQSVATSMNNQDPGGRW
jgi:hypothetical protein